MIMVGVDAHKRTLAVCVVDEIGRELAARTFANDAAEHRSLVAWAAKHAGGAPVEYGVESAFAFARGLVELLLASGLVVFDVPAKLVERSRRRRGIGKSDVIDAREIARSALRERRGLVAVRPTPAVVRDLKLLVDYRWQLARERTQTANRLHADMSALLAGYPALVANLDTKRGLAAAERLWLGEAESVQRTLALGRLARVRDLDHELKTVKIMIASAVERSGSGLMRHRGVGPITAGRILAEVRDVRRFPTPDAFARVNGTAPVPASSGQRDHYRLNRGGNRRLNYALHTMALAQSRSDPRARAYLEKHRSAGKTYRDAMRCLKRRLSDVVWRQLVADANAAG